MSARHLLPFMLLLLAACGGSSGGGGERGSAPLDEPAAVQNQAPVADARSSSSVQEASLVTLDGSASFDTDGRIDRFAWTQLAGPPVALSDGRAPSTSFTAPSVGRDTLLRFGLTVTDDRGASDSVEIDVNVRPARHSLSGVIVAAGGMAVDGDVNDPAAPRTSNDTPSTAQRLPNPVTLAGYAGLPGAGQTGALQPQGDPSDFYRIDVRIGQTVTLRMADPDQGDLDLYLWDAAGEQLRDASIDVSDRDAVTILSAGTYLLEVAAFRGASSYVLTIEDGAIAGIRGGLRLSDDFIPGEIIVEWTAAATGLDGRARAAGMRLPAADDALAGRPALVRLDGSTSRASHRSAGAEIGQGGAPAVRDADTRRRLETLLAVKRLRRDATVRYAQPNFRVQAQGVPNDPYFPLQWHYPMIHLAAAWDLGIGTGTTVAVLDTGVLPDHPDLAGQLVAGYDFVSSVDAAGDGDGIDPQPVDPGLSETGSAAPYHGTHVIGTVAAAAGNEQGTAGVAPGARVMPVRVLGIDGGSSYDILQGLRFASGLPNDSGVTVAPVDVINMSLGRRGTCWPAEQAAFDAARAAGVAVVAAAGNDAIDAADAFPANCDHVLAVGAVGSDGQRTPYSNFGSRVDVQAPGGHSRDRDGDGYPDGVLSLTGERQSDGVVRPGYGFRYGTSMASPHVAGVVAMMKSANPELTPNDLDRLLQAGELTDANGVINAYQALFAALNLAGTPPDPESLVGATPDSLNFGSIYNHAEVEVQRVPDAGAEPTATVDRAWLRVRPVTDGPGPVRRFSVTVDRHRLTPGTYSGVVTFEHAGSVVQVPVIMQSAETDAADAGQLYVLLVDADSGEVAAEAEVTASGGQYFYEFPDVSDGRYELVAGTDLDNDGTICDVGESCGAYHGTNRWGSDSGVLNVNRDFSGVQFSAGLTVSLSGTLSAGRELRRSASVTSSDKRPSL